MTAIAGPELTRLARIVEGALPGARVLKWEAVGDSERRTGRVFKARLADGRALAVKAFDQASRERFKTEYAALHMLHALGCAVPEPMACDPEEVLLTRWAGDRTLEDAISSGVATSTEMEAVIRGFVAIDHALDAAAMRVASGVRDASFAALESATRAEALQWVAELRRPDARNEPPLEAVLDQVLAGPRTFGCSDCSPSNVVLGERGPVFVDISAVGPGYPERRLASYLVATGSRRPGGTFQTPLDRRGADLFDRLSVRVGWGAGGAARLDTHLLLVCIGAMARITAALSQPRRKESKTLLRAWPNPRDRLRDLRILASYTLCDNPTGDALRDVLL